MGEVKIEIEPSTLIASLHILTRNPRVENELKIICSNLSEQYSVKESIFRIPWYDLRRGMDGVARILKKENFTIKLDTLAESLIEEMVNDRNSVSNRESPIKLNSHELKAMLSESGFQRELKDEQVRDALKLLSLRHGANFSVPGAGKTTTILAVHSVLKKRGIVSKLFIVSPLNAFISWEDEISAIFTSLPQNVRRFRDISQQFYANQGWEIPDIILINYEALRRDIAPLIPYFVTNRVHLILDESHRVKSGRNNISYNQIIKLADLAKRRDVLSGTPMPQSYLDLSPQFDFLWPGQKVIPDGLETNNAESIVNANISGLFVRTTKHELGLDEPIIKYTSVPMSPVQSELYRLFKSETARILVGIDRPNLYNFRRIGRSVVKLLQAATNPMLLTAKDDYPEDELPIPKNKEFWELLEDFRKHEKPSKIEHLRRRIIEIMQANHENKVLIWSYFVRNILILEKLFQEYDPVTIYGAIPSGSDLDENNREGRIKKFHKDTNCRIMIANPQACGEGISLHKVCHHDIYLDRNFNAAYFLQSIDRIHRLGLDRGIKTNIEILVSENTIDEILISRLNEKIIAMGNILNDPYLRSLAYDPEDIMGDAESGFDEIDFQLIKRHVEK